MAELNIAVLGSNSHIAKGLIANVLTRDADTLVLFTRDDRPVRCFLDGLQVGWAKRCRVMAGYDAFQGGRYDVIINCVGTGSPRKLRSVTDWFTVTETFDSLALCYLLAYPATAYIGFSSGAVYGRDTTGAVDERSAITLSPNAMRATDYYAIAKLNAEAKHRAHQDLWITDLRVFSYFSRFADLDAGYFITDALRCAADKTTLKTDGYDIVRDYVHPDDLYDLVRRCLSGGRRNNAFDVMSAAPASKFAILEHLAQTCGLHYEVVDRLSDVSPNGPAPVYYSRCNRAAAIGYRPRYTSLDTIGREAAQLLARLA